jgi:hypothetical protein
VYWGIGTANPQYDDHSPIEEAHMRQQTAVEENRTKRVARTRRQIAVTTATMVTLIATLGAPFKWAMLRHIPWLG